MFDHALGHHGANPHASTAGPQHHNALLRQAMRWLALNLQRPIHSCKSCCSRPLQCNAIQPLVVAQEHGLKLTMSGPRLLNVTSLSLSPSSPAYCTCFLQCNATQCNAMQCDAMRCNAMQCNGLAPVISTQAGIQSQLIQRCLPNLGSLILSSKKPLVIMK